MKILYPNRFGNNFYILRYNGKNGPDIGRDFGLSQTTAKKRGYNHQNDPQIQLFDFAPDLKLKMNIQTGKNLKLIKCRNFKIKLSWHDVILQIYE